MGLEETAFLDLMNRIRFLTTENPVAFTKNASGYVIVEFKEANFFFPCVKIFSLDRL